MNNMFTCINMIRSVETYEIVKI